MFDTDDLNLKAIVKGCLLFLLFAVWGIILLVGSASKIAQINDSHPVTARLVDYTRRTVEETADDYGTKTKIIYRCVWQYDVSGKQFTVTRNQSTPPASTTTFYINNHLPHNVVSRTNTTSGLLMLPLVCIGVSLVFLIGVYKEFKQPGTSFLSKEHD